MKRRTAWSYAATATAAAALLLPPAPASGAPTATAQAGEAAPHTGRNARDLREMLFVGNNWDGTVDVVSPDGLAKKARVDVMPDKAERMREIVTDPVRLAYFLAIRQLVGEGHDQYVDDMYTAPDGRTLVVSRPSFADVVAIDLGTGDLVWRFEVEGQRADHMAVSPDGRQVAVSASTANVVHLVDIETGRETGRFPTGDSPHENVYTRDGGKIFNASIGQVYTPLDQPVFDTTKGERYVQVVDADTREVVKRIDMGKKLDEAGYPDTSSAVRPMTFSPDERFVYFQVSFFHGFVEYDLEQDRVRRVVQLPIADHVKDMPREQYLLDSAHHGIAMNRRGDRICVAGTMSDYATVVSRSTLEHGELVKAGTRPYWATSSSDGRHCYVSWSGDDRISAISYETGKEVARVEVGDHPQRMRLGNVSADVLEGR